MVEVQECRQFHAAAEQAITDKLQIGVGLPGRLCEEELRADTIYIPRAGRSPITPDGRAQTLRQVGVTAGPVEHAAQQAGSRRGIPAGDQPVRQRRGFRLGEVGDHDAPPDVERRRLHVADQLLGGGGSRQAERDAPDGVLGGPPVVKLANAGEEVIGGEGEGADEVYLIHLDDQAVGHTRQDDGGERLHPALQWAELRVGAPEVAHGVSAAGLVGQPHQEAVVPFLGCGGAPNLRQVEEGDGHALLPKRHGGAHQERGFAHLPGIENVAEVARAQALQQRGVGLPHDVRGRVRRQGSADHIEGLMRGLHVWGDASPVRQGVPAPYRRSSTTTP